MRIRIISKTTAIIAELRDSPTARELIAALPCESQAQTWGDEVYFPLPVTAELEPDAKQVVDAGTVGFWVEGNSLALPYGPTPISRDNECRLVTRVNILGRIVGDARILARIRAGDPIRVETA